MNSCYIVLGNNNYITDIILLQAIIITLADIILLQAITHTVVWEKFTVGSFRLKIARGKIFLSLRVSDENFLTTKYFKVKLFVPLLKNLMHNYT